MAPAYSPRSNKSSRATGAVIGIVVSGLLFLAVPLTQMFTDFDKSPEEIMAIEVAPPPPPPPPEDPPEPPPPEEEPTPPEMETPPPNLTLEQLEVALNPGTGLAMNGDFALPSLNVDAKQLGGLEIFDINDVDKKPSPIKQSPPVYPIEANRRGLSGYARASFLIDKKGNVIEVKIISASDPIFKKPTIDAIRKWKFTPGENGGKPVVTRAEVPIPYQIQD